MTTVQDRAEAAAGARRWAGAMLLTVAAALALGGLTRAPYLAEPGDDAVLRLSWRMPAERVESCRELTEEEKARTPAHMRREEICEGRFISYQLHLFIDGEPLENRRVDPAGARGDRPLYVFREFRMPPGRKPVRVVFEPLWPAEAEAEQPPPAPLVLDEALILESRRVVLVTYDPDRRVLVARSGHGAAAGAARR